MRKKFFDTINRKNSGSIKDLTIDRVENVRSVDNDLHELIPEEPRLNFKNKSDGGNNDIFVPEKKKSRFGKVFWFILILIILVGIGYGGFIAFTMTQESTAILSIMPHGKVEAIDALFSASTTPLDQLPYSIVSYQKDGAVMLQSSHSTFTETFASGTIRVFNSYPTQQTLLVHTRFISPDGLIFKSAKKIVVPAAVKGTPGHANVVVIAEESGQKYNIGFSDFAIVAFKGTEKYSKVYARSVTEIAGGYVGQKANISEADRKNAIVSIHNQLEQSFIHQMQQNIPDHFIFPNNAYIISFTQQPDSMQQDGQVKLTERGTFKAVIFKREDLARAISKKLYSINSSLTQNTFFDMATSSALTFSFAQQTNILVGNKTPRTIKNSVATTTDSIDINLNQINTTNPLVFRLKGAATLVSGIDTEALKNDVVGRQRKSLNAILAGYPGVASADLVIKPFWVQTFPLEKDRIQIIVNDYGTK